MQLFIIFFEHTLTTSGPLLLDKRRILDFVDFTATAGEDFENSASRFQILFQIKVSDFKQRLKNAIFKQNKAVPFKFYSAPTKPAAPTKQAAPIIDVK